MPICCRKNGNDPQILTDIQRHNCVEHASDEEDFCLVHKKCKTSCITKFWYNTYSCSAKNLPKSTMVLFGFYLSGKIDHDNF